MLEYIIIHNMADNLDNTVQLMLYNLMWSLER